jgi:DNA-directed RNA polymerase specialized sigma24 family protein
MELVTVPEAARRLGVTEDTVKRRLRKGELQGERKARPQGYTWTVELPDEDAETESTVSSSGDDTVNHQMSNGEVRRLEEMVSMLQHQLEVREREVQELHVLLQQAQAALPAPKDNRSWWRFW